MPSRSSSFRFTPLTGLLVLGAIVLVVIGVIYLTTAAGSLPSFFPGHLAGSAHKHTKHALAAFGVAVVALIVAWMTTGTKAGARSS